MHGRESAEDHVVLHGDAPRERAIVGEDHVAPDRAVVYDMARGEGKPGNDNYNFPSAATEMTPI